MRAGCQIYPGLDANAERPEEDIKRCKNTCKTRGPDKTRGHGRRSWHQKRKKEPISTTTENCILAQRSLLKNSSLQYQSIRSKNHKVLTTDTQKHQRWKDHFEELLETENLTTGHDPIGTPSRELLIALQSKK